MSAQKLLVGFPRPAANLTDGDPVPGCLASIKWRCHDKTVAHLTVDQKPYGLFYFLRVYDKTGALIRGTPKVVHGRRDELSLLATLEKYL